MVTDPKSPLLLRLDIFVYRGTGDNSGNPKIARLDLSLFWLFLTPFHSRIWGREEMMCFAAPR
jgi:hypothetical protein